MFCYKQMAVFLLFLPFSTAPPLFMLLFTATVVYRFRPCVYCIVLLLITLTATNKASFMRDAFPPPQEALSVNFTSDPSHPSSPYQSVLAPFRDAGLRFAAPASPRSWSDLNGGKLLWPVLDGYELVEKRREQRRAARRKVLAAREPRDEQDNIADATEISGGNDLDQAEVNDSYNGDDEHFDPVVIDLEAESSRTEAPEPGAEQVPSDPSEAEQSQPSPSMSPRKSWFWRSKTPTPPDAPLPTPPAEPAASNIAVQVAPSDATQPRPSNAIPSPAIKQPLVDKDKVNIFGFPVRRRYDLRYKSVGFVVDLSMGRTDEAVQQEVEEWIEWEDQMDWEKWQEEDAKWAASQAKQAQDEEGVHAAEANPASQQDPPPAPRGWPWNRYLSKTKRSDGAAKETNDERHSGIAHLRLVEL